MCNYRPNIFLHIHCKVHGGVLQNKKKHRPHPSRCHMPLTVDNNEQDKIAKFVGVRLSDNLNFDEHATLVTFCSQRLYLTKLFCCQGMSVSELHVIFVDLIFNKINASSAWGGFLNSQQINRINALFKKSRWFGLWTSTCPCDLSEYLMMADSILSVSYTHLTLPTNREV